MIVAVLTREDVCMYNLPVHKRLIDRNVKYISPNQLNPLQFRSNVATAVTKDS